MQKLLHLLIIALLIFPAITNAETNTSGIKVAFIRDGYLWIKVNDKEEALTNKKATYNYAPQWSSDGKMLLYQKEVTGNIIETQKTSNELWVYDMKTKKHHKIFYDGQNPKWSPTENIVAFNDEGVLNISNLKAFYNIAFGVNDYAWQPDGKGFIASSSASPRPDGWTNPVLYTISIDKGYQNITGLTRNVNELFVIPKEVGIDDTKIPSINAGSFIYSPDKRWISFIISPTASWSMDSDMLAVITANGKKFEVIDEVILEFNPLWAYKQNLLGYIAGGGRIVFGFKNKKLKITELPAYHTVNLTPKEYAEMGFSWVTDNSLIVSRVQESEWSNDPAKRPKPSLYFLTLNGQKQLKITAPLDNEGDFQPIFLPAINKITWLRKDDIASAEGELWMANPNGDNAAVWVRNIELYSFYPDR